MFYIFLFIFIYKVIKTIKKKNSFIFNRELINFVFIRKIFKYDLLYQRNFAKNITLFFFNLFLHAKSPSAVSWFSETYRVHIFFILFPILWTNIRDVLSTVGTVGHREIQALLSRQSCFSFIPSFLFLFLPFARLHSAFPVFFPSSQPLNPF